MNDLARIRLAVNHGVISASELLSDGLDEHQIRALVARGALVRIRSGAFVDGTRWADVDAGSRHVLATRTILRRLDGYAAAHLSSLALFGLPVVAGDLGPVQVVQVGAGRARVAGDLRVYPPVRPEDVVPQLDVRAVRPEIAVARVSMTSMRAGVIAADAALRAGLTTKDALAAAANRTRNRPPDRLGRRPEQVVAALASPLSESPGESWTRLVLHGLGLTAEQQVDVRDAAGGLVGRVDFLLRNERVVIEFDGATKYAGADGREALVREKRREDRLRALGYHVVRLTWADLGRPQRVAMMVRGAVAA